MILRKIGFCYFALSLIMFNKGLGFGSFVDVSSESRTRAEEIEYLINLAQSFDLQDIKLDEYKISPLIRPAIQAAKARGLWEVAIKLIVFDAQTKYNHELKRLKSDITRESYCFSFLSLCVGGALGALGMSLAIKYFRQPSMAEKIYRVFC